MAIDEERVRALMRRAFAEGATIEGSTVRWDISGNCTDPVVRDIRGRLARNIREAVGTSELVPTGYAATGIRTPSSAQQAAMRELVVTPETPTRYSSLVYKVRCRRCDKCRALKAWQWRLRAQSEMQRSGRTWFGTLTLSPTEQSLSLLRAQRRAAKGGVVWEELSPTERFHRHVNAISPEITKFLKRVRKNSGAKLRYLLVAEAHRTGLPHFHLLVHEDHSTPVRHAVLKEAWTVGFSNFKLADAKSASYVTKYLAKAMLSRVRASIAYGNTT